MLKDRPISKIKKMLPETEIKSGDVLPRPVFMPEARGIKTARKVTPSLAGIEITKEETLIGRPFEDLPVDIAIEIKSVSRSPHAKLLFKNGKFYIKDENSRNGTFTGTGDDKAKLQAGFEEELSPGDILSFAASPPMVFKLRV